MIALYVQTMVLLGLAYFAGACLACIVRRSLFRPAVPAAAVERRVDPLPDVAARTARVAVPAAAVAVPAPQASVETQDLKRIRLIDQTLESALNRAGVTRYEHVAAWTAADVARFSRTLALGERISQENWIEQAQILAKGGETEYARRRARGEIATAVPALEAVRGAAREAAKDAAKELGLSSSVIPALRPQASTAGAAAVVAEVIRSPLPQPPASASAEPPSVIPPAARAAAADDTSPEVAARAAFATEAPRVAVPVRPGSAQPSDDFLRIGHIDAGLAEALAGAGVTRYGQMAQWSPVDVDRFDARLGTSGRIARENWVEQAQILSRGGDTAFSRQYDRLKGVTQPLRPARLADAIRENAGKEAAGKEPGADKPAARSEPAPPRATAVPTSGRETIRSRLHHGAADDLKRIRGIGVLIEKKLNSMGINGYEAIANWTAHDIDRVSQTLDFKGRIERDNWVEQARILASGGATDFSRRMDRGEIEQSSPRS